MASTTKPDSTQMTNFRLTAAERRILDINAKAHFQKRAGFIHLFIASLPDTPAGAAAHAKENPIRPR